MYYNHVYFILVMYYNHVYFILVMYYELVGSFGTCWWLWLMEKRRRAGIAPHSPIIMPVPRITRLV